MADLSKNNGDGKVPTGPDAVRAAIEGSRNPGESRKDDADEDDDADADDDSGKDSSGDNADDADGVDADDDADDGDASDDDDGANDDDDSRTPARKFSQFAGDGSDTAYIGNLEEGYKNSSAEAIRLKGELTTVQGRFDAIARVIASDAALATAFNKATDGKGTDDSGSGKSDDGSSKQSGLENPFVQSLQAEWMEKAESEIQEIIDANPEVASDQALASKVQHWMGVFSEEYRKEHNGRLMSGSAAMLEAMKYLGVEDKRGKQNLAEGAKGSLTKPRSRGNKASKSTGQKPQFTADQIAMAKNMGKDEAWLQKNSR